MALWRLLIFLLSVNGHEFIWKIMVCFTIAFSIVLNSDYFFSYTGCHARLESCNLDPKLEGEEMDSGFSQEHLYESECKSWANLVCWFQNLNLVCWFQFLSNNQYATHTPNILSINLKLTVNLVIDFPDISSFVCDLLVIRKPKWKRNL